MSAKNLGRLHKIDLREAWSSESHDFTPWLAQQENLALLGETIGIELELDSQEKEVGPFRADILCKDTATDNWVLIENQLERTDHAHLGQLLTYAAGLNAVTIVWIAERFTEEHRATLDWLNERTDETINLFGLEIELWKIADSPIAPKFNVISKPNDWSRTVKGIAGGDDEGAELKQLRLNFWTAFKQHMEAKNSIVRCNRQSAQSWMNHPIGVSGAHLASVVSLYKTGTGTRGPEIRAELYLKGSEAKHRFSGLEKQRQSIEKGLGFDLKWHSPEGRASCRLYTHREADFQNEALWPEQFEWLRLRLEKMHEVLAPIVKTLTLEATE